MVSVQDLHWICSVPVGIFISVIGLIGNLLSIVVWKRILNSKLRHNPSTGIYVIALAVCDFGLLLFFLLTDSLPMDRPGVKETYSYAAFFSYFGYPLFFIFLVASIWLVIGITVNRFVMIQFPTKVRDLYTWRRTFYGIAAIMSFSLAINVPHFFTFYPKETGNSTVQLSFTEFGASDQSKRYEFWAHCIFVVLAPWFSICMLNTIIIYKLRQQTEKFRSVTQGEKKGPKTKQERQERQMTTMLLTVTITFMVLLAWQCVTQCFWMLEYGKTENKESTKTWRLVDASFAFAKLGVIINSSINWFLYCITSSMFRKELRKLFYKIKNNHSITMSSLLGSNVSTQRESVADVVVVNSNIESNVH